MDFRRNLNQNRSSGGAGSQPRAPSFQARLNSWVMILAAVLAVFAIRLFYLQIVRHDYYHQQAANDQLKEYAIPADRGQIKAYSGPNVVPMALNQKLYTIFADPTLVKDQSQTADQLKHVLGGHAENYRKSLSTTNSRYVVIAKRISDAQQKKLVALKLPGIGSQPVDYRVYPQGKIAAQLLGFVNDEGQGNYGIEQYMNSNLAGKAGKLKSVTDVNGVPLVSGKDNVEIDPVPGRDVVLTVDVSMQQQLERLLRQGLANANSQSGGAVIIDPSSGAIKAMANWPTYDPSQYYKVKDASIFNNATVSSPLEVGSVMKVLTAAAALDQGVIKASTSFYDPAIWHIDGHDVTDVAEDGGAQRRTITDVLQYSLNTGATWMLMQMGGGQINKQARERWHEYLVNHYQFGKPTGIEQGYEAGGMVPDPNKGFGLNIEYANMSFGQAMTATPLQMAAALSSIVNGGTYYKPRLIDGTYNTAGELQKTKPAVVRRDVVSAKVGRDIRAVMEYMVAHHIFVPSFSSRYSVGGKTGTPQIANPAGGYYTDRYNGTYIGFVGGRRAAYVIVVRVNEPHGQKYAGSGAAQPIFGSIAHMLIDNFNVPTK